jgi:hypothetical protein
MIRASYFPAQKSEGECASLSSWAARQLQERTIYLGAAAARKRPHQLKKYPD